MISPVVHSPAFGLRCIDGASPRDSWYLGQLIGTEHLAVSDQSRSGVAPIVAVHDCGVDLGHPAFGNRCRLGRNFDPYVPGPWPIRGRASSQHGTLAALLAAGDDFGVAPSAHLLPVRYTGDKLRGWQESLLWAAEHADVVLCPWVLDPRCGVAGELTGFLEKHCLDRALFVCPVGNRPYTVGFPACLPGVLGVGAHTSELARADYSGCGHGLDVLAPSQGGARSLPAMPVYHVIGRSREALGWRTLSGTSAAAALAAGAAARVLAARPGLSAHQLCQLLQRSARPLGEGPALPWSAATGFGRLDCAAALTLAADFKEPGATP